MLCFLPRRMTTFCGYVTCIHPSAFPLTLPSTLPSPFPSTLPGLLPSTLPSIFPCGFLCPLLFHKMGPTVFEPTQAWDLLLDTVNKLNLLGSLSKKQAKRVEEAAVVLKTPQTTERRKRYKLFLYRVLRNAGPGERREARLLQLGPRRGYAGNRRYSCLNCFQIPCSKECIQTKLSSLHIIPLGGEVKESEGEICVFNSLLNISWVTHVQRLQIELRILNITKMPPHTAHIFFA